MVCKRYVYESVHLCFNFQLGQSRAPPPHIDIHIQKRCRCFFEVFVCHIVTEHKHTWHSLYAAKPKTAKCKRHILCSIHFVIQLCWLHITNILLLILRRPRWALKNFLFFSILLGEGPGIYCWKQIPIQNKKKDRWFHVWHTDKNGSETERVPPPQGREILQTQFLNLCIQI